MPSDIIKNLDRISLAELQEFVAGYADINKAFDNIIGD